jgi:hypothetical protein|tara:strand:+ start:3290 stop:3529 length:240 start_codon:yes stop_codon:yes gene_type:complete
MKKPIKYKKSGRDDSKLSIAACILFYQMLLDKKRISKNGSAVKRMHELEKKYFNGERNFKRRENEFQHATSKRQNGICK